MGYLTDSFRAKIQVKAKTSNPTRHVALLRGINVGGKNMLPMSELTKMFTAAGCDNVRTFIQSGNVIFDADQTSAKEAAKLVSAKIVQKFGCNIPIVLRTLNEFAESVSSNPFIKAGAAEDILHVMFLAGKPKPERIAALDAKRSPSDEFIVREREIYLKFPNGVARSKLTNAYFDSKLGTVSTARNWRTVLKLLELMKV